MGTPLVFVMYDSIHHSIFEGQVFTPLLKKLNSDIHSTVHIVSFEETLSQSVLATYKKFSEVDPRITITLFKRPQFIAQPFLLFQSLELKTLLTSHASYKLYARGPLAGIIAKKAVTKNCSSFTIQARGLLAEEHSYTHKNAHSYLWLVHALRTLQLSAVEKSAYTPQSSHSFPFFIEAVSSALKKYLIDTYHIPSALFTSPLFDAPPTLEYEKKLFYRHTVRTVLALDLQAPVYIYNGSLKAWQCPQETITIFKEQLTKDGKSIFIALTQDTNLMLELLNKAAISSASYRVLHVPQSEVIQYLCAGDYGILFREPHILNWVSRPTKLLEYEAVGLQIIHNNTIALLADK